MSDIPGIPDSTSGLIKRLLNPQLGRISRTFNSQNLLSMLPYLGPIGRSVNNLTNGATGASPKPIRYTGVKQSTAGDLGKSIGGALSKRDPLMDLYNQLVDQLSSPVNMPTGVDTQDLMQQVQDALNPIYDQRVDAAQTQSDRGQQEVENMYRALANDYKQLAPEQAAQAQAAKKEIEDLYGSLRSNIEGSYSRVSKEQSDLFKQLGIESALPDVMSDQNAAVTDALTAASQNQAQQAQRYNDIANMDQSYYREGAPLATMRGNEIRTDMLSQLQDYLKQIEAERTSGIQSTYTDQLNQANSLLGQQQQTAQNEASRRQEMLWNILQSQMSAGQQSAKLTPDTFMSGLPSATQQAVAQAFTQLQRSPEAVYGKTEDPRNPTPGTFVETTPQWYMAQADEMLKRGQIDAATHQALLMYLQLQFGK